MVTTKWLCKHDSTWIANHLLKSFEHYIQSTSVSDFSGIHQFVLRKRSIQMTFYYSPRALGYYSALPNYLELQYVLCHIEEKDEGKIKYEMDFSFDSEKMTFLELFDITYHETDDLIKEAREMDITFIETQLRNIVLSDIDY